MDAECRVFHLKGTNDYFFVEGKSKPAELRAPSEINRFENISLSRRTVPDRITDMVNGIKKKKTLKKSAREFKYFSLACDETADLTNATARDTANCESKEGGEDLFHQVAQAMNKSELPFEKLTGLATDGAPAMVGVACIN